MRNGLRDEYKRMGMTVDDQRLEELTNFAMAKRQGRMAKQMDKKSKAALAKYFGALVAKENAESNFTEHSQRLQSEIAAAVADKNEEKQMAYRDQLAEGGRIVIPIGPSPRRQSLMRYTLRAGDLTAENLGEFSFVPLIGADAWEEPRANNASSRQPGA